MFLQPSMFFFFFKVQMSLFTVSLALAGEDTYFDDDDDDDDGNNGDPSYPQNELSPLFLFVLETN